MILYKSTGDMPATWEDFLTKHPGAPNVTMITEAAREEYDVADSDGDGWVTVFLPGKVLTVERARKELARINGVNVNSIVIK